MKPRAGTKNDMWLFSYTAYMFLKVWSTEYFSNFNAQTTSKNTVRNLSSDSVPGRGQRFCISNNLMMLILLILGQDFEKKSIGN